MLKAWQYLQALSALPPRGSATDGERKAAAWLTERLESLGYEVERQKFRSPIHTLYMGPLAVMVLLLISVRFLSAWPAAAALVGIGALIPLVGEMLGAKLNLDYLLPKRNSQNVVARRPTSREVADEQLQVVIVA